jgi:hypothetical protein
MTTRMSSIEKEEKGLIIYVSCLLPPSIYFRHEDIFIYIIISMNYQHKFNEDTKRHVNHDGD